MTQTQEEMILIGAFGLFWLCTSIKLIVNWLNINKYVIRRG